MCGWSRKDEQRVLCGQPSQSAGVRGRVALNNSKLYFLCISQIRSAPYPWYRSPSDELMIFSDESSKLDSVLKSSEAAHGRFRGPCI